MPSDAVFFLIYWTEISSLSFLQEQLKRLGLSVILMGHVCLPDTI